MCDPIIGGILGLVGSVASAGIQASEQADLMDKQNQANEQWVAYQRQQAQQEFAKDEASRQQAQNAQQDTLSKVSGGAQMQQQQTEEARLNKSLLPTSLQASTGGGTPTIPGDVLLSGQNTTGQPMQQMIASQINDASAAARQRIAALATIQSFGGSQFGLQNYTGAAFQTGNQAIDLASNYRRGDLAAYNVAKNVEPLHYVASPSPFGGLASGLAGIAGKGLGTASLGGGGGGGSTMFGTFGSDMGLGSF